MNKKSRLIFIISLLSIALVLGVVSYAYFRNHKTQTSTNVVSTIDCLSITITNETDTINITDGYPIPDGEGLASTPYTFKVKNNCSSTIVSDITLESLAVATNALDKQYIKYSINEAGSTNLQAKYLKNITDNVEATIDGATSKTLISSVTFRINQERTYDLRLWIDEDTTIEQMGKTYKGKIVIVATAVPTSDNLITFNNNYDLTSMVGGASWSNDAIALDGNDDYVNLGIQNVSDEVTVDTKVKLNSVPNNEDVVILSNSDNGGIELSVDGGYPKFQAYIDTDGPSGVANDAKNKVIIDNLVGNVNNDGKAKLMADAQLVVVKSSKAIKANKYYNITGSYDGESLKLYVNGQLEASEDVTGIIKNSDNDTNMTVGVNPTSTSSSSNRLDGSVSSLKLYNKALSDSEVANNYSGDTTYSGMIKNIDTDNRDINAVTIVKEKDTTLEENIFAPEKVGDTFVGWYTAEHGGVKVDETTISKDSSITYYAHWSAGTYDLLYDCETNGGTGNSSVELTYNSNVSLSKTCSKSGWTFVGWHSNSNSTTTLSSFTMPASDTTLYAVYRKDAITLTASTKRNVASATGTDANVTCTIPAVYNNETQGTSCEVTLPNNPYSLTGSNFNGWVNTGSGTTTNEHSGTQAGTKLVISGNINLTATWATTNGGARYTLTTKCNGGTGGENTVSCALETLYNTATPATSCELTLPNSTCTRTGYTFNGWVNTNSDTTTSNETSGTQAGSNLTVTGNGNLVATWASNTVIINIRSNGSAWSDSGINVALYQSGTVKYAYSAATVSGSTVTWNNVETGTYDVYISKDENHKSTLADSNVNANVTGQNTSATVDYYGLTLSGSNMSSFSLNGTNVSAAVKVAKGVAHSIDCTPSTGFTFSSWTNSSDATLSFENANSKSTNVTITSASASSLPNVTVNVSDSEKPVASISNTRNLKVTSLTPTLSCTDNVGVTGYYWGTTSPTSSSTYTAVDSTTNFSTTKTISSLSANSVTYYFACKDAKGNVSTVTSKTYVKYTINNMQQKVGGLSASYDTTNYDTASTNTYITQSGTSLTLASVYTIPTYSRSAAFKGVSTASGGTVTTTEPTVAAGGTYYMWFTRNRLIFRYAPNGGTLMTPTKSATDGTVYNWSVTSDGVIANSNSSSGIANAFTYTGGNVTIDVADANNVSYMYIKKDNYSITETAAYKYKSCDYCSGGSATTSTTFSQESSVINAKTLFGDACFKGHDCTVVVEPNWVAANYSASYTNSGTTTTLYAMTLMSGNSYITSNSYMNPSKSGTIKVLKSNTDSSSVVVPQGTTVSLDLNNLAVTRAGTITNNGNLRVYGKTTAGDNVGIMKITNSAAYSLINNKGKLYVGTSDNSSYAILSSNGVNYATIVGEEGNIYIYGENGVANINTHIYSTATMGVKVRGGTLSMVGGKISCTSGCEFSSLNNEGGSVSISGGVVSAVDKYALHIHAPATISGDAVLTSDNMRAVYVDSTTLNIKGGLIYTASTGQDSAIYSTDGTITMSGGNVISNSSYAIYYTGTNNISITGNPVIAAKGSGDNAATAIYAPNVIVYLNTSDSSPLAAGSGSSILSTGSYATYSYRVVYGNANVSSSWNSYAPSLYSGRAKASYLKTGSASSYAYYRSGKIYSAATSANCPTTSAATAAQVNTAMIDGTGSVTLSGSKASAYKLKYTTGTATKAVPRYPNSSEKINISVSYSCALYSS